MFGFTFMAVTFRGVFAEDKDLSELSALNVCSVCPCGSMLMSRLNNVQSQLNSLPSVYKNLYTYGSLS